MRMSVRGKLTTAWRLMLVVTHLARGVATAALVLPLVGSQRRERLIANWSAGVLAIFRLTPVVRGHVPVDGAMPVLLVANHVSWLDIFAIRAHVPARFIAKSEVRRWPIVGWLAQRIDTMFLPRQRLRALPEAAREVCRRLTAGQTVCLFPEATTTDGTAVHPFAAALFEPAITAGAHVLPLAIAYRDAQGRPCTEHAFIGSTSLVASIVALVGAEPAVIELSFAPPIEAIPHDRRSLARAAHASIRHLLHADAPDRAVVAA